MRIRRSTTELHPLVQVFGPVFKNVRITWTLEKRIECIRQIGGVYIG